MSASGAGGDDPEARRRLLAQMLNGGGGTQVGTGWWHPGQGSSTAAAAVAAQSGRAPGVADGAALAYVATLNAELRATLQTALYGNNSSVAQGTNNGHNLLQSYLSAGNGNNNASAAQLGLGHTNAALPSAALNGSGSSNGGHTSSYPPQDDDDGLGQRWSPLGLDEWIETNRTNIKLESRQMETAEWRNYLGRCVLVLKSLVEKIAAGGDGTERISVHPDAIAARNTYVQELTSQMAGKNEVVADFVRGGDPPSSDGGKFFAMDALGRLAYDMFMLNEGPSVDQFRNTSAKTDKTDKDEVMSEEEVIEMLCKMPRMTTSEQKDSSGLVDTMLKANVPFPCCRFVSDLLGGDGTPRHRSEYSFSSFADVLSDLTQMVDNPDAFLYSSSTYRWKLSFGEKLYGREGAMKEILDAAERLTSVHDDPLLDGLFTLFGGRKEIILVSGHSGAGKSRLVRLAGASLEQKGWRYLSCKFDRVAHSEPLSIIACAFEAHLASMFAGCPLHGSDGLLDSSVECSCAGLKLIRRRLEQIVGIEGLGILVKHIPSLRIAMDNVTIPPSTAEATESSMHNAFGKLLQALSSEKSPVLFFVDDLQWADPLSLAMLTALVRGARTDLLHLTSSDSDSESLGSLDEDSHVLFVASYRDNEVDGELAKVLGKFRADTSSITTTDIALSGFNAETLTEMLSETLATPKRRVRSLSALVLNKTDGQPLYVIEFIQSLTAKKLLTHNFSRGWEWDADSIDICPITDSVAELFVHRLLKLPKDILLSLQILSCFGSIVDGHVLGFLANYDGSLSVDMSAAVHVAVREGLLEQAGEGSYHSVRFVHDMVQKATHDSISEDDLVPLLRKLAAALIMNSSAAGELDSVLFIVVDLIDRIGSNDSPSREERKLYADLNLRAATKAVSVPDFASAARYAERGIAFLDENCWETQYKLSLGLYETAVRSHFSSRGGDREQLTKRIDAVFTHGKGFADKFKTLCVWIELLSTTDLSRAIQESLNALEKLEEPLDVADVGYAEVCEELKKCEEQLAAGREKGFLSESRLGDDSNKAMAMKVLVFLFVYYCRQKSFLGAFVSCRMIKLTVEHGHCQESVFGTAAFASSLINIREDIDVANEWGKMALSLMRQYDRGSHLVPTVTPALYGAVFVWKEPIQSTLEPLTEGIRSSLAMGDVEFAAVNTGFFTVRSFNCGTNLAVLRRDIEALSRQFGNHFGNDAPLYSALLQFWLTPLYLTLQKLEGTEGSDRKSSFPLDKVRIVNNDDILQLVLDTEQFSCLHNNLTYQTAVAFLFRDMEGALRYTDMYVEHFLSKEERFKYSEIYTQYYEGLITFYWFRKTGEKKYRARGEAAMAKMRGWTRHSLWNFRSKLLLMEAEWHSSMKNDNKAAACYEGSIKAARNHQFLHEEGLACELAAAFYLERGFDAKSLELYERSMESYKRWGALAVVRRVSNDCRGHGLQLEPLVEESIKKDATGVRSVETSAATDVPPETSSFSVKTSSTIAVPAEEPPSLRKRPVTESSESPMDLSCDSESPTDLVLATNTGSDMNILSPGQNVPPEESSFAKASKTSDVPPDASSSLRKRPLAERAEKPTDSPETTTDPPPATNTSSVVPPEEPSSLRKRPATESLDSPMDLSSESPTDLAPAANTGSVILSPGKNGATEDKRFLQGKCFLLVGAFVEVSSSDRTAANTAVMNMLSSFGATIATRLSKGTTYVLAGKFADATKINSAKKRDPPVEVINLYRLQKLLLGELTFEACRALPELTAGSFTNKTYQPARKVPDATGSKMQPAVCPPPNATGEAQPAFGLTESILDSLQTFKS